MMAAEMAVIRLTHVADLPSPEELVRKLTESNPPPAGGGGGGARPAGTGGATARGGPGPGGNGGGGVTGARGTGLATAQAMAVDPLAQYARFEDVLELVRAHRDLRLLIEIENHVRLVSYTPGRVAFAPTDDAPRDLAQRMARALQGWTGVRWGVSVEATGGQPTIAETRSAAEDDLRRQALAHPLVAAVMQAFPTARITDVRSRDALAAEALTEALPEVEDEWDPFEED
jgi:DNA polymerase-3 subunit gamma/tau